MKKNSAVFEDHAATGPALFFSQVLLAFGMCIGLIVETLRGLLPYWPSQRARSKALGTKKGAVKASGKISTKMPAREFRS